MLDLGTLRSTVIPDVMFDVLGVPATVTPPEDLPVSTRGIWLTPLVEEQPIGRDYSRREPRRVMALRRDVFSEVPRNTRVIAAEKPGGTVRNWRVDGLDATEPDHFRVVLVPEKVTA